MLNHTIGPVDYHRDDDWKEKVLASYEQNVRRMVAIAREKGIPILLVTPASNEKDCSPFKWEYSEGISDENRGRSLLCSILSTEKRSTSPVNQSWMPYKHARCWILAMP